MISNKIKDGIVGNINIPPDKSISHRSIIIPSISMGVSEIPIEIEGIIIDLCEIDLSDGILIFPTIPFFILFDII